MIPTHLLSFQDQQCRQYWPECLRYPKEPRNFLEFLKLYSTFEFVWAPNFHLLKSGSYSWMIPTHLLSFQDQQCRQYWLECLRYPKEPRNFLEFLKLCSIFEFVLEPKVHLLKLSGWSVQLRMNHWFEKLLRIKSYCALRMNIYLHTALKLNMHIVLIFRCMFVVWL